MIIKYIRIAVDSSDRNENNFSSNVTAHLNFTGKNNEIEKNKNKIPTSENGDKDEKDDRLQIKEVKSLSYGPTNNDVQFVIQVFHDKIQIPKPTDFDAVLLHF